MAIAGNVPTVDLDSDRTAGIIMTRFTNVVLIQTCATDTDPVEAAAHRFPLDATNHVACLWWGSHRPRSALTPEQ
jgi:hypothetical protein